MKLIWNVVTEGGLLFLTLLVVLKARLVGAYESTVGAYAYPTRLSIHLSTLVDGPHR